jgi:localization factor PodJL
VAIDDQAAFAWFLLAEQAGSLRAKDAVQRANREVKPFQSDVFEKVGDMYAQGAEIPINSNQAIAWYRKAAQGGTPEMMVKLAGLLIMNPSMSPDPAEALGLCEKAAKSKFATAFYCLGDIYQRGLGVQKDSSKAAKYFMQATNSGQGYAALRLGEMYWNGEGVNIDKITAYELIYLAARSGIKQAITDRDNWEKEMTPGEISKAKGKAAKFTPVGPVILKSR